MSEEQLYVFVDKSGHCFDDFQTTKNCDECFNKRDCNNCSLRRYNGVVGAFFKGGRKFTVGDMLAFKQDLLDAGFKWGVDFYVRKVK